MTEDVMDFPADAVWVVAPPLRDSADMTLVAHALWAQNSWRRRFFLRLAGSGPPTEQELTEADRKRGLCRQLSALGMDAALVDERLKVYGWRDREGNVHPEGGEA